MNCLTNNVLDMNIENFETYLRQGNMAENTIAAYHYAVKEYYSRHKELNKRNLLVYKTYLIEKFKPKTVNLRIQAMNKYLDYMNKSRLRLKSVKVQQRSYLENVISNADYAFLKNKLKKEENQEWYFVVRFLAATGARVSELIQMKVEHVQIGYFDIYTKGGKIRRIYIPKSLRKEATEWLNSTNRTSGYLFLNRFGERITTRGIAQQLKNYATKYGLNEKVVYPHSFRHRFAKNFLEKFNDISLLADLMGHESPSFQIPLKELHINYQSSQCQTKIRIQYPESDNGTFGYPAIKRKRSVRFYIFIDFFPVISMKCLQFCYLLLK